MNKRILKSAYISIICPLLTLFILPYLQMQTKQHFYKRHHINMESSNYFLVSFLLWFLLVLILYKLSKISLKNINKTNLICLIIGFSLSLFIFINFFLVTNFIYIIKFFYLIIPYTNISYVLITFSLYTILLTECSYKLYKIRLDK